MLEQIEQNNAPKIFIWKLRNRIKDKQTHNEMSPMQQSAILRTAILMTHPSIHSKQVRNQIHTEEVQGSLSPFTSFESYRWGFQGEVGWICAARRENRIFE